MPGNLFERLSARLLESGAQVTLSGMGDPLSHPEWERFVRGYRERGGEMGVQVSAASLSSERTERLVAAAPSFINLSLPSTSAETLRQLLPGCDPDELLQTALRLAERCRRHLPLSIIVLRTGLETEAEQASTVSFWKQRKVQVRLFDCHSRGGNLIGERLLGRGRSIGLDRPCGLFARHAFVTWQGQLLACCHDLGGETRLGDLAREAIELLAERKRERSGLVPPFELCRDCDEPLRFLPLPEGAPPVDRRQRSRYLRRLKSFRATCVG